jgi:hypothetical protein
MALSPEEWKQAQAAGDEVKRREQLRNPITYLGLVPGLIFFSEHFNDPKVTKWAWASLLGLLGLLVFGFANNWRIYRKVNARYTANLQLLESFREKDPGLFASSDSPLAEHPALEGWSRSLDKRAILWRVDRFLSGGQRD